MAAAINAKEELTMLALETVYQPDSRASIMILFDLQDSEQRRAFLIHQAAFQGNIAFEWLNRNGRVAALHLFPGGALKVAL